jgi:soluble lytic murein transglycosylase
MITSRRIRSRLAALLAGVVLCTAFTTAAHAADSLEKQRREYRAAMRAVSKDDLRTFRRLRPRLDGYVLAPYLDYAYLSDRLSSASAAELRGFLADNEHVVVSEQLRRKWLTQLARKGQWTLFLSEYRDIRGDTTLRCNRLERLLKKGPPDAGLAAEVKEVWLNGRSQPKACDPVFTAAYKAGVLDRDTVWDRIRLAMERGQLGLAGYVGRTYLNAADQRWVKRWAAIYRNPRASLERISEPLDDPVGRMVIAHGVVRLARLDPDDAMRLWKALAQDPHFTREDRDYVFREVGVMAARQHHPEAARWLAAVSENGLDAEVREWRVRAAMRAGDWPLALRFIKELPDEERKQDDWRYVSARVMERNGESVRARELFTALATERSYYGFLSADRLNLDYAMQHSSVDVSKQELKTMESRPAIAVAHELFIIGKVLDARRQWAWATRNMTSRELEVAASLASRWGWHDRAILTIAKSGHHDDLEIRFPVLYRDLIEANAKRTEIDPAWVYGVVRQESAFITDARSPAGALGLMQLMPRTGRQVARQIKIPARSTYSILKVDNNLALGTSYLKSVLEQNRGSQLLATASYNAGPHRVKKWLPDAGLLDADVWVEGIPFNETRNYVKNVMGFAAIYDYRLGRELTRLRDRMPPVAAADE